MPINYQGVNPPTGWVNAPSTASPRNAENLQIMNAGTKAACNGVDALFGDMASEYSASSTYAVGQYCIRNNLFYRCTVAIGTPEPWNASKWAATTVGAEFKAVNDKDVMQNLSGSFISNIHTSISVTSANVGKRGNNIQFYVLLVFTNTPSGTTIFRTSYSPLANYVLYSLRQNASPYNVVNDESIWITSTGEARIYSSAAFSGTYYLAGEFTCR